MHAYGEGIGDCCGPWCTSAAEQLSVHATRMPGDFGHGQIHRQACIWSGLGVGVKCSDGQPEERSVAVVNSFTLNRFT